VVRDVTKWYKILVSFSSIAYLGGWGCYIVYVIQVVDGHAQVARSFRCQKTIGLLKWYGMLERNEKFSLVTYICGCIKKKLCSKVWFQGKDSLMLIYTSIRLWWLAKSTLVRLIL
jgi:hypothetical protein